MQDPTDHQAHVPIDSNQDEMIMELETNILRFRESLDQEEVECLKNVDKEIDNFRKIFESDLLKNNLKEE